MGLFHVAYACFSMHLQVVFVCSHKNYAKINNRIKFRGKCLMSSHQFRHAMSKFATGITIVTSQVNDEVRGMTVNAFMSVSLEPKLITISVDKKTNFYKNHKDIERFGISVLREEQKDISMIFAKQVNKAYDDFGILDDVPVINNALTTLACTVSQTVEAGDHLLVIAEVDAIQMNDGNPILYFDSKYRTLRNED